MLIAHEDPFALIGLEAVVKQGGYEVIAKARDGKMCLEAFTESSPEVLILDAEMAGYNEIDVLRTLRSKTDSVAIILLTAGLDDTRLIECVDLGINGIVLKAGGEPQLFECLDRVHSGGRWIEPGLMQRVLEAKVSSGASAPLTQLSSRERAIIREVREGRRNREIAAELGLSEPTVKIYLHRLYQKLGVSSRTALALLVADDS
jgi:two-component system nitrate/nitrite response regulator NarP